MFEHRTDPLLPGHRFVWRALRVFLPSAATIGTALGIGVLGYHFFDGPPWIDALVNASMILGGMGPVDPIATQAGKLFASAYALFSGLLFVGAASLVMAPFVHHIMHTIHLDTDDRAEPPRRDGAPRSGTSSTSTTVPSGRMSASRIVPNLARPRISQGVAPGDVAVSGHPGKTGCPWQGPGRRESTRPAAPRRLTRGPCRPYTSLQGATEWFFSQRLPGGSRWPAVPTGPDLDAAPAR